MFAGSAIGIHAPLEIGRSARLTLTVHSLEHKVGSSGDLVFVNLHRVVAQDGADRVTEMQTIVYRSRQDPIEPIPRKGLPQAAEEWIPNTVELFRFSAATFNAHRIHYDLPYARQEEGYPALVVQGPLVAAKLCAFGQRGETKPLTRFSFRVLAPLFVDQPVQLRQRPTEGAVEAVRCDGIVAVSATCTV